MRRAGAIYKEIGKHLGVSEGRARQLVMHALRAEARGNGELQPTRDALHGIRQRFSRPF
jgi:hypothetical protein